MLIPPYRITLSGGGVKGFAHIGALEVLSERGFLKSLREYVGISAGAIIAFCLCIGCTLSELRMVISLLDFGLVRDLEPETMLSFPETYGLDTGANLDKLLRTILRSKKLDPKLTFEGLAKLRIGLNLRIIVMNMNTCLPQEFSLKHSPKTEICLAVRASMSIPVYFSPVREPITGHYLSDGGIYSSSPFVYLSKEERDNTLAIAFNDTHKPKEKIETIQQYLLQLYYCIDYGHTHELKKGWSQRILFIDCGAVNTLNFELTAEGKMRLMEVGRKSAEKYLRKGSGRIPARRFSL